MCLLHRAFLTHRSPQTSKRPLRLCQQNESEIALAKAKHPHMIVFGKVLAYESPGEAAGPPYNNLIRSGSSTTGGYGRSHPWHVRPRREAAALIQGGCI
jgi:hypothetical protein